VVEDWLKRDQAGNRSRDSVERIMRREVLPSLGARPFAEVRKRELIALVEGVMDRGVPSMANRVLAHVKRLFSWAASRDLIETDPAAHIERPGEVVRRDRVLSDPELVAVWRAAEGVGGPFGAGVRLLIATGARREEVFACEWAEIDAEHACIRLPPARNKVKEPRVIPLSPLALKVLDELPRLGRFVVSTRGDKAFANAGHAKAKLDATIARQRAEVRLGRPLAEGEEPAADDALPAHGGCTTCVARWPPACSSWACGWR